MAYFTKGATPPWGKKKGEAPVPAIGQKKKMAAEGRKRATKSKGR